MLDYYADISRLKSFHGIQRVNVEKIYAYGMHWLLQRRPLQTKASVPDSLCFINEMTVLLMYLPKMLVNLGLSVNSVTKGRRSLLTFAELLYYNFRYRHYQQQSLELMISAFFTGYRLSAGDPDKNTVPAQGAANS